MNVTENIKGMFYFIILQTLWKCYLWMFCEPSEIVAVQKMLDKHATRKKNDFDDFVLMLKTNVVKTDVLLMLLEESLFITWREPCQNAEHKSSENVPYSLPGTHCVLLEQI